MELFKEFSFEAAHHLPGVPEGHKCRRLHGHSFRFEVHVAGAVDEETGMIVDYGDLTAAVRPVLDGELDHRYLNEIPGLENPTSEHLARWLWVRLRDRVPGLTRIVVRETCLTGCVYAGED